MEIKAVGEIDCNGCFTTINGKSLSSIVSQSVLKENMPDQYNYVHLFGVVHITIEEIKPNIQVNGEDFVEEPE